MVRPSGSWGAPRSCGQGVAVDPIAAAPGLEHEKCPKREAPVTSETAVLPDDALQRFSFEHVTHHGAGREQLLPDVVAQAILEPIAERNRKPLLSAPEERRGKVALHGLAQQIFLPALGQLGAELHA